MWSRVTSDILDSHPFRLRESLDGAATDSFGLYDRVRGECSADRRAITNAMNAMMIPARNVSVRLSRPCRLKYAKIVLVLTLRARGRCALGQAYPPASYKSSPRCDDQ